MKKHILYGLEASSGGALKHVLYLATRLNKQRFRITVALSARRDPGIVAEIEKLRRQQIDVVVIDMRRQIHPWADLIALVKVCLLIRRGHFDIVHAHSSKAGLLFRLAAWMCRIPVIIYTPHCFYFQGQRGLARKLFASGEKLLAKLTQYIIVSESERKEALAEGVCAAGKLRNINNAIDLGDYPSVLPGGVIRERYGIPEGALVIGGVGRLEKQKNFGLLIDVAADICRRYDHVCFVVAGEGSHQSRLRGLIEKAGLKNRVFLTGYVNKIEEIYSIIDIYLSTSLWEGLPYALLEAAFFRKPIIASHGSDFPEMLLSREPARSASVQLIARISALIENKKLMIQSGNMNRHITEGKHSFPIFLQRHEALYLDPE